MCFEMGRTYHFASVPVTSVREARKLNGGITNVYMRAACGRMVDAIPTRLNELPAEFAQRWGYKICSLCQRKENDA